MNPIVHDIPRYHDNRASRRAAEKAGYTLEGVMRSCWFHRGRFHDLEIWPMLRSELPA